MKAEELIEEAKKRYEYTSAAYDKIYKAFKEDLGIALGDQWPDDIARDRLANDRPSLTINRIPQFVRQVTNDARHNRPSPKATPVGDGASKETAEIMNGLIRHIQSTSDASVAYDMAVQCQVIGGLGYIRLVTDYCDEKSFDQDIKIKRVLNPLTILIDADCQEPDGSDAKYAFVTDDMTPEAFKEAYPNSKMASADSFASGNGDDPWVSEKTIRVVEYFKVTEEEKTIYLLHDGQTTDVKPETQLMIANERVTKTRKVKWYKLSAMDILEEGEWPGKYIPIIPVYGDEFIYNGQRYLIGLVRYARDPQRMLNYWVSAQTEMIALAPKAPFIMAEGQDEGYEQFWDNANTQSYSRLVYKPVSLGGQALPPPQRQVAEPPVQAMAQATNMASQFLKDTTGIYDAGLGSQGSETSGKAILARQKESDVSNFHFTDNFARSIRYLGRMLVDLFPKIYDTQRVVRIVEPDGTERQVMINQPSADAGMAGVFDLTKGRYDVVIESGPSYNTKREQTADAMLQVSNAYPPLWDKAGDLMVKNFDWPGADKLAERLQMFLPPEVKQKEQQGNQLMPPQLQAQMAQMTQMMDAMSQELNVASEEVDKLKSQQTLKVMEIESRERIATMNAQVEILKTQATLESKGHLAAFQNEVALLQKRMDMMLAREQQSYQELEEPPAMEAQEMQNPAMEMSEPLPQQ